VFALIRTLGAEKGIYVLIGPVYGGISNFLISLVRGIALSEWATVPQLDEDSPLQKPF
jgi:hypothetical protein